MLVLSKMKQKLSRDMLKLYNSVPDELKQEFNRRRKEFVKNNTLKLWKKFLIDLYDKQSRSTPKHFPDYIKGMFRKMRNVDKGIKMYNYGQKKIKRKSKMKKEKISQSLKTKCKKLKVRLTMKRGGKRVYKSVKVLKRQCEKASKKGKRKFGAARRSGRVVPQMSGGFGRPYFGYTVGGTVRFGSRRPEFHYPEHVLKGYNTAKTSKKYRFGKPRKHRELTKKELMALSGLGGLGLGVGGTLGYQHLRRKTKKKKNSLLTPMNNYDNFLFDGEQESPEIIDYGTLYFGSRRPEFHYPEHILKGYNTAKDCKKYRFGKPEKKVNYRRKRLESDLRKLRGYANSDQIGAALVGFPNWNFLGMKGGTFSDKGRMNYFMVEASKKGVTMTKQDAKKYLEIMNKIVEKETLTKEDKNFVAKFKITTKSQLSKAAWCLKNSRKCTGVKFVLEIASLLGMYWATIAMIVGGINLVSIVGTHLYRRYRLMRGERSAIDGQRRRRRNQGNIQANADRIREQIIRGEIRDPDPAYTDQLVESDETYIPYARNINDETEEKYKEIDKNANLDIPKHYVGPMSMLIMRDPVIASDGNTYERSTIEYWLRTKNTSPLTNAPLRNTILTPNNSLRSEIDEFVHREWNKLQGSSEPVVEETTIAEPDTIVPPESSGLGDLDMNQPSAQPTQEQRRTAASEAALRRMRTQFGKRKVKRKVKKRKVKRKVKKRKVTKRKVKKRKVKKRKVTKRKVTKRKGTKKK